MLSPFTGDGPGKYNVVYNVTVRNDGVNCGARIWALWKVLWKVFVCFRLKIGMWMVTTLQDLIGALQVAL